MGYAYPWSGGPKPGSIVRVRRDAASNLRSRVGEVVEHKNNGALVLHRNGMLYGWAWHELDVCIGRTWYGLRKWRPVLSLAEFLRSRGALE